MDLGVQLAGVGVGGACDEALVGVVDVERVQVGEHSLRDGQGHGEQPDGCSSQHDPLGGAGGLQLQGTDDGSVPEGEQGVGLSGVMS